MRRVIPVVLWVNFDIDSENAKVVVVVVENGDGNNVDVQRERDITSLTYREATELGARQLFHLMDMMDDDAGQRLKDENNNNSGIDADGI